MADVLTNPAAVTEVQRGIASLTEAAAAAGDRFRHEAGTTFGVGLNNKPDQQTTSPDKYPETLEFNSPYAGAVAGSDGADKIRKDETGASGGHSGEGLHKRQRGEGGDHSGPKDPAGKQGCGDGATATQGGATAPDGQTHGEGGLHQAPDGQKTHKEGGEGLFQPGPDIQKTHKEGGEGVYQPGPDIQKTHKEGGEGVYQPGPDIRTQKQNPGNEQIPDVPFKPGTVRTPDLKTIVEPERPDKAAPTPAVPLAAPAPAKPVTGNQ